MRCNVVLPGGGRNYPYIAGALQGLIDGGVGITGIGGTSAGGLVALFVALGRRPLLEYVLGAARIRHTSRTGWWWPSHPFGKYTGEEVARYVRRELKPTLGEARIPCGVVVANLSKRRQEILSSWETPSEETWVAARATSCVPFLFEPVMIEGRGLCVDGGLTSNAAGDDFKFPNDEKTLTVTLTDSGERRDPDTLGAYVTSLVTTVLNENVREDEGELTLRLPTPEGDSLDLELTEAEAQRLFVQGYIRGRRFASRHSR